jgi:hypothetical protein
LGFANAECVLFSSSEIMTSNTDELSVMTPLSSEACRKRISEAEGNGAVQVGYALASTMDVIDGGDQFELRHKIEPILFVGRVLCDGQGSVVRGNLAIPARGLYAGILIFV